MYIKRKRSCDRKKIEEGLADLYVPITYIIIFFIFCYIPMAGIQIAFKEFTPYMGIFKSPWVGMEQFKRFFDSYQFKTVITNTLKISLSNLVFGFPVPILLALMINQLNFTKLKKYCRQQHMLLILFLFLRWWE